MTFWGLTHVGTWNNVLDGGQNRTNPFAPARGDKLAMRPFANLLWTRYSRMSIEIGKGTLYKI